MFFNRNKMADDYACTKLECVPCNNRDNDLDAVGIINVFPRPHVTYSLLRIPNFLGGLARPSRQLEWWCWRLQIKIIGCHAIRTSYLIPRVCTPCRYHVTVYFNLWEQWVQAPREFVATRGVCDEKFTKVNSRENSWYLTDRWGKVTIIRYCLSKWLMKVEDKYNFIFSLIYALKTLLSLRIKWYESASFTSNWP